MLSFESKYLGDPSAKVVLVRTEDDSTIERSMQPPCCLLFWKGTLGFRL